MTNLHTIECANCGNAIEIDSSVRDVVCPKCSTHQLIEHHDGIEEVIEDSPAPHRVIDVFRYLVRHPFEMLVLRWNWKAAVFSGILRSMIYLFTHLTEGWRAALGAMSIEFSFRLVMSGASGSLVQSFHRATPIWLATLCVMIMLPAFSHVIEFTLHTLNGDANKGKAIIISITFSILSAIFNLFAMRRNALLVKDANAGSLFQDLAKMPKIVGEFVGFPVIWLLSRSKKKVDPASVHLSLNPNIVKPEH